MDFIETDSDDGDRKPSGEETTFTEEEIESIKESILALKAEGNAFFTAGDHDNALAKYSDAINLGKQYGLPKDTVILANRSATYLALKRYVPACHDATQSAQADPTNWKAYWRQGVALMSMGKKKFRTKSAIAAFESCLGAPSLPESKKRDVVEALTAAKRLLQAQDDATPMPDMSNCAPS